MPFLIDDTAGEAGDNVLAFAGRERPAAQAPDLAFARIDLAREADFSLGQARVRPSAGEIRTPQASIRLQPRVMQVLVALARADEGLVTREALAQSCWGGVVVGEDAVNRCIQQLRRLAERDAPGIFSIETLPRLGYRMTAGAPLQADAVSGPVTLAVLPFASLSSDPDQEHFCDGLSAELLAHLARLKRLRVAARSSSFALKHKRLDIRLVGESLGVDNVLEGSVRRAGERLRITAQLIDCADGYHLWSQTFDRRLGDVLQVQQDVAHIAARAVGARLGVIGPVVANELEALAVAALVASEPG